MRVEVVVFLRVIAAGHLVAEVERAAVGLGLACEDTQEARLAGSVQAKHEDALAPTEVK
ncbi:unannotated protein [freshwater metagenome]|uniref:Unannotated protein n=1 Tax=freshwater metagenome TaxID=449393 RepID=A0A6J6RCC1_9ZZZZ